MKKLIIKTTLITLSAIVLFLAIVFGMFCAFKPVAIANLFDDLGCYSASIRFYEMQYEKTQDINDLIVIVDKTYDKQKNEDLERYLNTLTRHKDFMKYCQSKNANLETGEMLTEEFYVGFHVIVLIEIDDFDYALDVSNYFVECFGYTKFNPFRHIIGDCLSDLSDSQKEQLESAIIGHSQNITDATQQGYITQDLTNFN